MAREKFYGKGGTSEPDAGVAEILARVDAQRAAKTTAEAVTYDAHHEGILSRTREQQAKAQAAAKARDAEHMKAAVKATKGRKATTSGE